MKLGVFAKWNKKLRIFNKKYHYEEDKIYVVQCEDWQECWNKKKNTKYTYLGKVINCTNKQDGQEMCFYSDGVNFFVREKEEFNDKFLM